MPVQKGKNDIAWEQLFARYDILRKIDKDGQFIISADQIREYREPRLMAKFDHRINLPQVFAQNGLSILPISRGDYMISHFEAYHLFDKEEPVPIRASLPAHLESLDPGNIPSEAIAVNCALASGILADFLGENRLAATVSGRMTSDCFDFKIRHTRTGCNIPVAVDHAQIEIDAAYEGTHSLTLMEAKRDVSEDFLIRQLYYPFRVWSSRVHKPVRPVFLVYSNGIFSLYEYAFSDPSHYNSLQLVRHRNYTLEDTAITRVDLERLLQDLPCNPEPEIPFPQADSIKRVINLCELLLSGSLSREEITQRYAFDARQTNYYTDAGRYLGLIERTQQQRQTQYHLTEVGRRIMRLPYRRRQLGICGQILQHAVFRRALCLTLKAGSVPDRSRIVSIMKQSNLFHIGQDSTYLRRASTVCGWTHWMYELMDPAT